MRLPLSRLFQAGPLRGPAATILPALIVVLLFALISFSMSGCALFQSPNEALVTGIDAGLNSSGLLDEYDKYVEADGNLKSDSKKIRHDTAFKLRKLISDAQGKQSAPTSPKSVPTPPPK